MHGGTDPIPPSEKRSDGQENGPSRTEPLHTGTRMEFVD